MMKTYKELLNNIGKNRGRFAKVLATLTTSFLFPLEAFASSSNEDEISLASTICIAVITAASLAVVFNRIKLPALLAYIGAGLLIGGFGQEFLGSSLEDLEDFSHIGLILLLFIIGMEMNPSILKVIGTRTTVAVMLQAPVTIGLLYGIQWLLFQYDIVLPGLSQNPDAWLYYAAAVAFGSTAVVIKLLGDKFDLGSQAGKLTVVTLIMQDIWAVVVISYTQSQGQGGDSNIWLMIGGGIALLVAFVFAAKYFLGAIFKQLERSPDLLLFVSLGWCFLGAESFSYIGLSGEIGALVAGLTVGRLPQHVEIFAKTLSLRDFFMALFFVVLGISLPTPSTDTIFPALALVGLTMAARLLIYTPMLLAAKQSPIVALVTPINLTQLSVFALVFIGLAVQHGILEPRDQVIVSYALLISIMLTAFTIPNNYRIGRAIGKVLLKPTTNNSSSNPSPLSNEIDIVMLGFFINGLSILRRIRETQPELLKKIVVVDFQTNNPLLKEFPEVKVKYGDISQVDTLRHCGVPNAKVVISTINNAFLHGTRNEDLILSISKINPKARIITTSLYSDNINDHINLGAYDSISTANESAKAYTKSIVRALQKSKNKRRYSRHNQTGYMNLEAKQVDM